MVSDEDLAAWQQHANAGELCTSDARRLLIALLYERGMHKRLEEEVLTARANHEHCADTLQARQKRIEQLHAQVDPLRERMQQAHEALDVLRREFFKDGNTDWAMVERIDGIAMLLDRTSRQDV